MRTVTKNFLQVSIYLPIERGNMYYIYFDQGYSITEENEVAIDFSWWKDLVRIYCHKADYFEIRLWEDEQNDRAREFCQNYAAYEEEEGNQRVYAGMMDDAFREELLDIAIGEEGIPIFFSLWLYRDGEQILSSDHNGMEFMLLGFDEHSVVAAAEELEQVYGIKEIQIYTDEHEMPIEVETITDEEIQDLIHALQEGVHVPNEEV